jgi:hypothetical protein
MEHNMKRIIAIALSAGLLVPVGALAQTPPPAKNSAPGQIQKRTDETAKENSPGQIQKRTNETAKENAPGQQGRTPAAPNSPKK